MHGERLEPGLDEHVTLVALPDELEADAERNVREAQSIEAGGDAERDPGRAELEMVHSRLEVGELLDQPVRQRVQDVLDHRRVGRRLAVDRLERGQAPGRPDVRLRNLALDHAPGPDHDLATRPLVEVGNHGWVVPGHTAFGPRYHDRPLVIVGADELAIVLLEERFHGGRDERRLRTRPALRLGGAAEVRRLGVEHDELLVIGHRPRVEVRLRRHAGSDDLCLVLDDARQVLVDNERSTLQHSQVGRAAAPGASRLTERDLLVGLGPLIRSGERGGGSELGGAACLGLGINRGNGCGLGLSRSALGALRRWGRCVTCEERAHGPGLIGRGHGAVGEGRQEGGRGEQLDRTRRHVALLVKVSVSFFSRATRDEENRYSHIYFLHPKNTREV